MKSYVPRLVVLELTRRCNLNCIHCRASASAPIQIEQEKNELPTGVWLKLLQDISSFTQPIIILSGGEALLREDIFEIISYACQKGLTPVLATCGTPLTEEKAEKLKTAGIRRVSVSLDGKDALTHDMIRGVSGVFEKAVSCMRILRDKGIEFQVNTLVYRYNLDQLADILELAKTYGAASFHPFFMVPVGRAQCLIDRQISDQECEEVLSWLYYKSGECALSLRPTCAPAYFRILSQNNFSAQDLGLDAKTQGCLAGRFFCFISSEAKVYPCGFLEIECGDMRKDSFEKIWQDSRVFNNLRDLTKYKGKCGECEYWAVCGGCRARAFEDSGDYLEEEPICNYQPLSAKS